MAGATRNMQQCINQIKKKNNNGGICQKMTGVTI
jgi:hypothetical protein